MMTTDSYNVWSTRDLVIVTTVLALATFWVLRKKSTRERIAMVAAGIVLVLLNAAVFWLFKPKDQWRGALPLTDILLWIAALVCLLFNRIAGNKRAPDRGKI
jgi:hypothetical protein